MGMGGLGFGGLGLWTDGGRSWGVRGLCNNLSHGLRGRLPPPRPPSWLL